MRLSAATAAATAPRLRVVSVCRLLPTPQDPAAGTFIFNRIAALACRAHVRLIQPLPYFPVARPLPKWAEAPMRTSAGMSIAHAPMFYVPGVLKGFDGRWLARSVRSQVRAWHAAEGIDLIDAHFGYPEGAGCAAIARELGVPLFVTIRGTEADMLKRPQVSEHLLMALREARGVVSVSHSLRALMTSNGVDPERIAVIPNAVDRARFHPGDRAQARAALGIAPHDVVIVSVGHLLSVKRHTILIEAMRRLRQTHTAKLVIIGGPSYEPGYPQALRAQVEQAGLGGVVSFAGSLPPAEVAQWLRAANLFALASAREGCCNALLEALACGLPAVVTAVGDNPHFVRPGLDGDLVAVDDAAQLHVALRAALERTWDGVAISRRLSVGDWDQVALRLVEFFSTRRGERA